MQRNPAPEQLILIDAGGLAVGVLEYEDLVRSAQSVRSVYPRSQ
jgi:hypothetical protein